MKIAISSGHGKYIRGASGSPVPPQLDEVDEARRVVDRVAEYLDANGVSVDTFHDDTSHDQGTNLERICDWHNEEAFDGEDHDYDISVHFNAYDGSAHGCEVLWVTQEVLAIQISGAIAEAGGFTNRGAPYRSDLKFLNSTREKAVLIETCFCDNTSDSQKYRAAFDEICWSIAETLCGRAIERPPSEIEPPPPDETEPPDGALFYAKGKCSTFGGPDDEDPDNALAFFYDYADAPQLFLIDYDANDLFHSLNPAVYYLACRWDYDVTPKEMLRNTMIKALVRANGREWLAHPSDWGPHGDTDRVVDLSPGLAAALCVETDDIVEVIYPAPFAVT